MKRIQYFFHAAALLLLLAFDQGTKYLARTYLPGKPKSLIDGVFSFTYHENRGSVWGILQGKIPLFLITSVILFVVLAYVYIRTPKKRLYYPLLWVLVFMTAGALGNTIDRACFGYVTDFLYFELINFPVFNMADCYITVTAFLTVLLIFTKYQNDEFSFLSIRGKGGRHADEESDET